MQNVIPQEQFITTKLFPTDAAHESGLWHYVLMSNFEAPELHLAAWRNQAQFSQEELAERVGYSRGYIAKAETRPQNVTLQFLSSFAEGVNAPNVQALFAHPDSFNSTLVELQRYFLAIREPEQQATVLSVAKGLSEQTHGSAVNAQQ